MSVTTARLRGRGASATALPFGKKILEISERERGGVEPASAGRVTGVGLGEGI
jgi:hypothetical protein